MVDNQIVSRIAQKIRSTRLEKNLTIQELATRTHVSKGLLSKIENSRTIPSLPVFVTLIQSLEISLKEFFHDMVLVNGKGYLIVKKDQYTPVKQERAPGLEYFYILSQSITNCMMEIGIFKLDENVKTKATSFHGYEFLYVLSGSCEYNFGGDALVLSEGDSIYIDASVLHAARNNEKEKAVLLSIHFILPG
jgi:transcriptional regulator with XRE-family HTH domain